MNLNYWNSYYCIIISCRNILCSKDKNDKNNKFFDLNQKLSPLGINAKISNNVSNLYNVKKLDEFISELLNSNYELLYDKLKLLKPIIDDIKVKNTFLESNNID
ncbi:hypothetical protein [Mycoplasmopsis verecunda]|uniref:hypothetical protein n=1 Tax=Mycoplasmopsis verecunda TaxID=171291 RepID=UPI0011807A10|nr:hypothetical protein [Mycoplasmopsis verecunda]WPB54273.1 hypothetical protein SAM46_02175 [Mycoplasmopsis verecunda]